MSKQNKMQKKIGKVRLGKKVAIVVASIVLLVAILYLNRALILRTVSPKYYVELSVIKSFKNISKVYETDTDKIFDKKFYFEMKDTDNPAISKISTRFTGSIDSIIDYSKKEASIDIHGGIMGINFINIETYTDGENLIADTGKRLGGLYAIDDSTLKSILANYNVGISNDNDSLLDMIFNRSEYYKQYYEQFIDSIKTLEVSCGDSRQIEINNKKVTVDIYTLKNEQYDIELYIDRELGLVGMSVPYTIFGKECSLDIIDTSSDRSFSECDITAYVDKYSYELEYTYTKKEGQVNKLSMEGATSISADVINGVSWYDIVSKLSNLLDE